MQATRIVVISPSDGLASELARQFPAPRFEIVDVRPGSELLRVVRRDRPGIAVIDRIDDRPEAAQLEIAVLKDLCPEVEIIALSVHSSEKDAWVAEQGVFYYTAAAPASELVRVIRAAEQTVATRKEHGTES